MSVMVERAKWLARMVHADQTRIGGEPYYIHCDAVEEAVKDKSDEIRAAAQMHDVLEHAKDPDLIRTLISFYFPDKVLYIVEILTNDKNIYYNHYIDVICNHPEDAFIIKMADMTNNALSPNATEKQLNKYKEACLIIIGRGKEIPKVLKDKLKIEDNKVENKVN